MKTAFSNIAWNLDEEDEVLKLLVQNNINLLEVAPTKYWSNPAAVTPVEIETRKQRINDAGLDIIAAQALLFGHPEFSVFGNKKTRQQTLDYLCRISETCVQLGAKALVFGAPKNRLIGELDKQKALEIAVRFFEDAAERVFALGGILCLEPNPVEYGCDFINSTKEAIEFIRHINQPGLRIQLDTSTITLNKEDPSRVVEQGLAWAGHFHISEPFLGITGSGNTDHAAIAGKLQSMSFEGPVSVEMRSGLAKSNREAIKNSIKVIKKFYAN